MMFINNIVAVAILAASAVTPRTITLCDDPDFVNCQYPPASTDLCGQTPLFDSSNLFFLLNKADKFKENLRMGSDRASSLDTLGATCEFFVDFYCFPQSGSFNYTGKIDKLFLAPGLEHFDDTISSFRCK
ncbi:hypothetical protein MBM_08772 [Drepanopeziza brunnea f. sp. 'multigermtubi' MB_m1]|uniref:Uncharacterized protein n=1 Tax=Marssonina brunnea f. sp. multigermtubi (strain MB_m1) TaxID=1072389 RepID=K1W7F7_MARBU|nr:uncharacterized protein MBM_08772 [Drepanopeziza brunnea f. sp. 'multigermtubi' MB_m1]EKD13010.1 hypothetical protein MBM_08772 [Drepanopeziza brunnea f. sp. 'multigermtubi' MB_m1]